MRAYRLFLTLTGLACLVLVAQLVRLQLVEQSTYDTLAKQNIARTLRVDAARGFVRGADGELLVQNLPFFSILLFPALVEEMDTTLAILAKAVGRSERVLRQEVLPHGRTAEPLIIAENVSSTVASRLAEHRPLPGVLIQAQPVRHYPHGDVGAHLLGYVGEVSKEELDAGRGRYYLGEVKGKLGLERYYDEVLRGTPGFERVLLAAEEDEVTLVTYQNPVPGENLTIGLDLGLQRAVEQWLAPYAGAVVALSPKDGRVLALASSPDFDPNWFLAPIPAWRWEALQRMNHPFLNRALSQYPPGSTFKLVVAGAALEEGVVTPEELFRCRGFFELGDRKAACWKRGGHGQVTLQRGIEESCDVVFYQLGLRLGVARLTDYARRCGFGVRTGIDLPDEGKGLIPTPEWKERVVGEPWYDGDTINLAIGQGYLQVTPLQLAAFYAALARGGERVVPHVVQDAEVRGGVSAVAADRDGQDVPRLPFSTATIQFLQDALRGVVTDGTGRAAQIRGLDVFGKTGTAEDPPRRPHAWFACYAFPPEGEEPRGKGIVLSIFIEEGEHGDQVAARLAGQILRWWRQR